MPKPIRVGIIGVSAKGGWARDGHVPAVQALEGLEFVAVADEQPENGGRIRPGLRRPGRLWQRDGSHPGLLTSTW